MVKVNVVLDRERLEPSLIEVARPVVSSLKIPFHW